MELKMTAQQVEDLIHLGFAAKRKLLTIEEVRSNYVRARLPYRESMLRPGNVLSGPALFTAADLVMYALVLSHIGPELMAVTANSNMNFLAKAKPGDIVGEGRMLRLAGGDGGPRCIPPPSRERWWHMSPAAMRCL